MVIETKIFTRCSLFVEIHLLLVTRCKICSLLVAEVALCKKPLVTRCKKSLVTRCKIRSLLVAEVARCKKSLVTRCKIRSLLVAEVVRCKKSLAPTKKLNKDTTEISVIYILPMYPLSLTLSMLLPTIQKPSR